jgi:tRNA A-37 threonylcarbamoyl transferase component Bud32
VPDPRRFRDGDLVVATPAHAEGPVRLHVLPEPRRLLAAGTPVHENLYRAAARVDVPGLGPLLLKVHTPHGMGDRARAVLRESRAKAEWRAARFLRGAGLPTPEPIVLAERRRGLVVGEAASAARFLERRETLAPALRAQPPDKARALLERVARWVRAMHDRGVAHGDLHSGNVLVGPGPGDRCDLHLVDLHAARFGRPVSAVARAANLAQLLHSLREAIGPGGRLRALHAYLGASPARATLRQVVARVERLVRARERRRVASRTRRCVEESGQFTRDVGTGAGFRRREVSVARIDAAIAAHDRALALRTEAVAKDGRKSRVTRHGDVVVKEALSPGALDRAKDLAAPSRRRAGYRNAHGLVVRGIGTAAPLAVVERGGRRFALYEDLSALPRLDHRVIAAEKARPGRRGRRRAFVEATADFVARLHRTGVYHGDLKACNVLVEERGLALAFRLIDTDRVRFLRRVSRRRRLKNLAQLAASTPRSVTRTDRLRWFRRYARGTDLAGREAERSAAREVGELLARKTVVVDDPIE